MHPEIWTSMRHVLLTCFLAEQDLLSSLLPLIHLVSTVLTTTKIQFLILEPHQYGFYRIEHQVRPELVTPLFISDLISDRAYSNLIDAIKRISFDAAIILTTPTQSPFSLAYLCYLANIPIRVGQSQEFAGGVLSHAIQPPLEAVSVIDYNLHLLQSVGLIDNSRSLNLPRSNSPPVRRSRMCNGCIVTEIT